MVPLVSVKRTARYVRRSSTMLDLGDVSAASFSVANSRLAMDAAVEVLVDALSRKGFVEF